MKYQITFHATKMVDDWDNEQGASGKTRMIDEWSHSMESNSKPTRTDFANFVTLVDEGLGEALLVEEEALVSMDDDEREELSYLGNAGEACDLTNVGLEPVRFSVTRDRELLAMFKDARENGLANLGQL